MKKTLFLIIFLFLFSYYISADTQSIKLASWNVRILSSSSRDDQELSSIASIINRYDLVAIQELRDNEVIDRLLSMLPGEYEAAVSGKTGRGIKEQYAFFYNSSLIDTLGSPYLFGDPDDLLIREPFIGHFRAGSFDFTLISIHSIYGAFVHDRRAEISLMDDILTLVDEANGAEEDVILLGDFNMPADDYSWEMEGFTNLIPPHMKTTITETSSYDNMWFSRDTFEHEFSVFYELYNFDELIFADDDAEASKAVSDHRSISVLMNVNGTDDDPEGSWDTVSGFPSAPAQNSSFPVEGDVRIISVTLSPTEDEQITVQNREAFTIDISSWSLGDKNDPDSCRFTHGTILRQGEQLRLGHDRLGFTINNSGEVLYLKNRSGELIDRWP